MNPISKYLLAIALIIILFSGVIPSVVSSDWSWFGRSGALLTAYGIAITFFDLTGFIDKSAEDIGAKIDRDLAKKDLSQVPQEKIDKIEKYKQEILTGVSTSLRRVEFFTLISGTIIWGYGDLLFA